MLSLAVIASFALGAAEPELAVEHAGRTVTVSGAHFALTVDASKGGEMTSLRLYDGAGWHEVLAGTFPALRFHDGASEWKLALDPHKGEIRQVEREGRAVRIHTCGVLRRDDGKGSPWGIDLRYEIHPEGAVFLDMECTLVSVPFVLSEASASFTVRPEVAAYPRYRAQQVGKQEMPFRSFRAAFGANPARSFTNEIEVIVEDNRPLSGTAAYESDAARAAWFLGRGGETLEPGFQYRNRFALGLGGAATGKPRSNVVGQRVYHVVNWLDLEHWYPAREHIDAMVDNHATMLILHHEYLLQRGSNGHPHAEYRVARDPDAMARTIDYAHAKGLRVGLYMRGVEWYALETGFFEKYCTRNLDGIYLDWHGPFAVAWHEARYAAEPFLGDRHFSEDGLYTPARGYFLLMRRLRETVGPDGFLIGHQGSFNSGVFANLGFDAYLPGETGSDRHMFSARDEAAYKGMLGGGVCMPWTLDLPDYQNAEGAAKMAVWGVYPHIVTGIVARRDPRCDVSTRSQRRSLPVCAALLAVAGHHRRGKGGGVQLALDERRRAREFQSESGSARVPGIAGPVSGHRGQSRRRTRLCSIKTGSRRAGHDGRLRGGPRRCRDRRGNPVPLGGPCPAHVHPAPVGHRRVFLLTRR